MGTRWLDEDEQATWRTVLRHSVLLLDRLDADLRREHDLSLADYEILVQLSEAADQRLRMNELADQALVSRSRLTHRIDRLVRAGQVERQPVPPTAGASSRCSARPDASCSSEAAPTHVAGVRRYLIDPLSAATQRGLVDELAQSLADLETLGPTGGCSPED